MSPGRSRRHAPSPRDVPGGRALALVAPLLVVLALGIAACVAAVLAAVTGVHGRTPRRPRREADEWGRGPTITLDEAAYRRVGPSDCAAAQLERSAISRSSSARSRGSTSA
jgi:hypothetical protein